ncbi:MAG: hypothetical protein Q7V01_02960 [Vicinamibacterales bacterium]|nr:hypothetical protein [Vicinamibacterales bacterium]
MTREADQYCRDLEAHLCRRNAGHLVRIVGPSFEAVQRWFQRGVPFKVACLGVDRHVERTVAKSPERRRPVRIEFCEADVMDAFDEWRRAVGVRASDLTPGRPDEGDVPDEPRPRVSLAAHLERTIARVTALRSEVQAQAAWCAALDAAVRRLDVLVAPARKARGEAREAILRELARLDADLLGEAARLAEPDQVARALAEAEADLAPFRPRLGEADYAAALERGRGRALRLRLGLPTIFLD